MTTKPKLLPCPFCKPPTPLYIGVDGHQGNRMVMCEDCGCEGPRMPTEAEAMEAWNTRATPPLLPVVAEFAKRMNEQLLANMHKGTREEWRKRSPYRTSEQIIDVAKELLELAPVAAETKEPQARTSAEMAVNISNYALMLCDAAGGLDK